MPLKTIADETPTMNLVSMIDVMLVLIIFFTVGTTFIDAERNIDVKLPEVRNRGALTAAPDKKIINVSDSGAIVIDQESVSISELESRLRDGRSQYAQLGVVVRGDRAVRLQTLAEVLQACKEAGIQDLGISVKLDQ